MGVRENLSKGNLLYVGIGAGVCVVLALFMVFWPFGAGGKTSDAARAMRPLKCTRPGCGGESEASWGVVFKKIGLESEGATIPGIPCPTCGQETLAVAAKCPRDGTVFHVARGGKCPKCGLDPAAEAAAQVAQSLKK